MLKNIFTLSFFLLLTGLISNSYAQQRHCDLQIELLNPEDSAVIKLYSSFDVKVKIKNWGPDTLKSNDTILYNLSNFMAVDYRKFSVPSDIAPGAEDEWTIHSITNINDNENEEYVDFCVRIKDNNDGKFTDTIANNNQSCHQVLFRSTNNIHQTTHKNTYFKIAPNPANNELNVLLTDHISEPVSFRIFDLLGRKVADIQSIKSFSIPIQNLSNGVYILQAVNGHHTHTVQFIKQ